MIAGFFLEKPRKGLNTRDRKRTVLTLDRFRLFRSHHQQCVCAAACQEFAGLKKGTSSSTSQKMNFPLHERQKEIAKR